MPLIRHSVTGKVPTSNRLRQKVVTVTTMSSSRERRRASERRLVKVSKRTPITIWTIIIIVLVALAVGIARIMR